MVECFFLKLCLRRLCASKVSELPDRISDIADITRRTRRAKIELMQASVVEINFNIRDRPALKSAQGVRLQSIRACFCRDSFGGSDRSALIKMKRTD